MAAQTSLNRISAYSKVLSKNCRKQSMLTLTLCALGALLCCIHFIAFGEIDNSGAREFLEIATLVNAAAALSGVLLIPAIFRELYNRQYADVEFSLPMSASERYRSKLLVLIKYHLIPFAAAQLVILISGLVFVKGDTAACIVSMVMVNMARMLFTDAVSLVCISSCGCIVECIYTPLCLGVALPVIPTEFMRKIVQTLSYRTSTCEFVYTPFGFIGGIYSFDASNDPIGEVHILAASLNILISLVLVFAAFRIYKKRDGLSVGKPFVFKAFGRVFTAICTLAVILLFFLNSLYNAILFGLLFFLAVTVSSKRRGIVLRDIMFGLTGYLACLASVLVIGFVSFITGGFGFAKMSVSRGGADGDPTGEVWLSIENSSYSFDNADDSVECDCWLKASEADSLFDEIEALNPRNSRSFTENISAYYKLIKNAYGDESERFSGVRASVEWKLYDEEDNETYNAIWCPLTREQAAEFKAKKKAEGFDLLSYMERYHSDYSESEEYEVEPGPVAEEEYAE